MRLLELRSFRRFAQNRLALLSLVFLIGVSLMAIFAPFVTTFSFDQQILEARLQGPSAAHWMGTDSLGRDLYSRIVYGARISLAVGVCTTIVTLIVGTVIGALAGYRGGWTDHLLMKLVDLFYIFPSILIAILLMLLLGRGFWGIVIALSLTSWVTQARLIRAQVLQAREFLYVESARAIGLRPTPIVWRHILPNIVGPVIVSLTVQIPATIMTESFLSFIGLGIQPPFSSWGTLANEGFRAMRSFPHLIIYPGLVLSLTMFAFSYLGDGLRDWLDPKSGIQI